MEIYVPLLSKGINSQNLHFGDKFKERGCCSTLKMFTIDQIKAMHRRMHFYNKEFPFSKGIT